MKQRRIYAVAPVILALLVPAFSVVMATVCARPAAAQHVVHEEGVNLFEAFGGLEYDDAIPSPLESLGYQIGEQFTPHHKVMSYLAALADASDRVIIEQYGETWEGRGLFILTISSPENLARLDEILARNRGLADPRPITAARAREGEGDGGEASAADLEARIRETLETNPAIAWFSYNVHGNEASCSEAAMQVAYTLAAATNQEIEYILDHVVIVIDPMLNPDGRDRYVNWFRSTRGAAANPSPDAAEHDEPWPGGRTNHYYFDLNRDWVWLIHPESQGRLAAYRRYMPQLHIDHHEQGHLNPFFLGAGDKPYNLNIPEESKEWIDRYGMVNAAAFDELGLIYSTRERFDYLYPGYGKVLPVYHGAVGMLAEKAGHGFAGLAVEIDEQNTLTLSERARDHFVLSMSNAMMTATSRRAQLERFQRFFERAVELDNAKPRAYIVSSATDPALLALLWRVCAGQGIEIDILQSATELRGLSEYLRGDAVESVMAPAGSWVIRADQPMSNLIHALFERSTEVEDPDTYDITGWTLPLAFGLDAWYSDAAITAPLAPLTAWERPAATITGAGDVAIVIDSAQHDFPKAVGLAVEYELFLRATGSASEVDGRRFERGSLVVHRIRNADRDLDAFVNDVLASGVNVHLTDSGLTDSGPVLGADENGRLTLPKVLLVRGSPMSSNSFGQHWLLLDVMSPIPYTAVNADALSRVDLDEYNVIVVPSGGGLSDRVKEWVEAGGALIACDRSASWVSRSYLEIEPADLDAKVEERPAESEMSFEERRQRDIEDRVPGSVIRVRLDITHPLTAGLPEWMGVIKSGSGALGVSDNGYVIARIDEENPLISGILSERNSTRIAGEPFVTHHRLGRGNVILFDDDVTFRGFQHRAMRLLLNAIIYGPSL